MSDSIKVAIKVRPLIKREKDDNLSPQWKVQGNTIVSTDTELKKRGDGGYCFDHIFDMDASNADIFDSIVRPIVDATVNGFNGTVFAYGQTSSGKTYTMMGTRDEPGIVPLAIEHMFNAITNTAGREFLLRVSYLEIYKEKVNDLLNNTGIDLKLKEDTSGQVFLQCKEEITNSPDNMISIMKKGDKNRRTGETNMNERSSRSHTIFRITIESREASGDSDSVIQVSQLNLVDLAGSERARQTGATGERFKEGLHINLSLSTLGLVIKQLSECQDGQKYVNFRDSKLTRLLQNSLGGNAMTIIICAVTPAAVDETQCTLSFACRAKSVKNKPQVNEVMSDGALLKRYAKQISKLQTELEKIKQKNRVAEVEEMESKLQEKERMNQLLEERIELLKTRIVSGDTASENSFKIKAKRRQTWGGPGMLNFRPAFQPTTGLPTIKEVSYEKPCRKSIIQSVDLMNQTFQTAFTDFELELFKSECDRVNDEENDTDSDNELFVKKHKHRVTFRDEVVTIKSDRLSATPERPNRNIACQTISCQASPSTPKHILRQCINQLTRDFVELRQFTTLEKQLLSREDGVLEYTPEVKKRLGSLNLTEETNAQRVIAELCLRLDKLEKQNILEKEASRKAMKQFSEVETQLKNITSERDEFEYMSGELRADLKKKTAELELKNMSEESVKEVELKKISELERKLKDVTLEYTELRGESTKRIGELEKEVENIVSERKEFELIRRELCTQLSIKALELDKLKNDSETANAEMKFQILQLEKRNGEIASEKAVVEQRDNAELRIEHTEVHQLMEKISDLQKQVQSRITEKNELERINTELRSELGQRITELSNMVTSKQIENQNTMERVSELQRQLESTVSTKVEFEHVNSKLKQKVSELEAKTTEQMEATLELKSKNESLKSEKDELHRVVAEMNEEKSKMEIAMEKFGELETQVETVIHEKKELEEKLNTVITSKTTEQIEATLELQSKIESLKSEKDELHRVIAEMSEEKLKLEIAMGKFGELETQVETVVQEKKELEERLNAVITSKTTEQIEATLEFESKIESLKSEKDELYRVVAEMSEEKSKMEIAMEKFGELETQVETVIHEKKELEERLNAVIISKTTEQIEATLEFESKIESLKSEKDELHRVVAEMSEEKSKLEIAMEKFGELETQVETVIHEKKELEERLNTINKAKTTEQMEAILVLESNIESLKTEKDELHRVVAEMSEEKSKLEIAMGKFGELETQVETVVQEKKELEERLNAVITSKTTEQIEATLEFESNIESLKTEKDELHRVVAEMSEEKSKLEIAMGKFGELETQVETVVQEKKELEERLNAVITSKTTDQIEATLEFESKIESLKSEKDELHRVVAEMSEEKSKMEIAMEKFGELETQVETVIHEKKELEEKLDTVITSKTTEQIEATLEFESKIESLKSEKDELHRVIAEMSEEKLKLEIAMEKFGELETQMETVIHEKKELEKKLNTIISGKSELIQDDNLVSEDGDCFMNQSAKDCLDNQSFLSCSKQYNDSTFDTSALMLSTEKSQLEESLYLKSQELNEIKSDVQSFRQDIENLQKTIYLLTTENMDMAGKLTAERENAKQAEATLQKTIDELYSRISDVTNQKITLESNLAALNDQLESMRSRDAMLEAASNKDEPFTSYRNKIDKLTAENIELSTSIAEKNKELESIKESKSLLFDHECMYKEKMVALTERNECLRKENDELSTDLMDKIEDNDELKQQCEIFKKKMEGFLSKDEDSTEEDANDIRSQNSMLKAEIVELKIKVTTLSEENTKFSNDLLETFEELENSRKEKFDDGAETSCKESLQEENYEAPTLADKVALLQEKVNQLTRLNKKLSDLKLVSCNQCSHLKNLNESRRTLKLEAKSLNQKLEDLQRKFDRKCEDTEILKSKINQELNTSGNELSANVSFVDEMNVSFVEERVRTLNDELQTLKVDHDKLTVLYEDKCSELEQLRSNANIDQSSDHDSTPKKRSQKNSYRVVQIQSHIDQLKTDIDGMRKNSTNFAATLNQFRAEKASLLEKIDGLRASNEELEQKLSTNENIAAEKIQILENELTNMSKELEQLSDREKTLESQRLTSEMELEELKIERDNKTAMIESLRNDLDSATKKNQLITISMDNRLREELETSRRQHEELNQQALARIGELEKHLLQREQLCEELQKKGVYVEQLYQQSEQEKRILMEKLQMVEVNLQSNFEARYKGELESISAQYQHRIGETENNLQKLNDTLKKYVDDNQNLKQELAKLKNVEEKQNESASSKERIDEIERLNGELSDIRRCMMKELRSLKCTVNCAELSRQSVNEIFLILVQTLVSKEQEMIKTIRETYEKDKQLLEDEIQQSADSEKRATTWAKELESEIEKLQTELTERERSQKECENKISQKEYLLRESIRENEVLRDNMKILEADLHNLQTEFEKLHKVDNEQEEAIYVAQKREKEVQEIFKSKDLEFQLKLKAETEMYEKRINELARTIESYKTKNMEMSSVVEGLEANEKQLKNIIEANAIEIKKSGHSLERLSAELQELTDAYNEANQQLDQKASHIEEISAILRSKCDTLAEYKAKLDAILPEFEVLKNHVDDQRTTIERYRQEVETLKTEREEQLEAIKDKLKAEEIKNAGISKQQNSKNDALTEELNELKEKYEMLKQDNIKLERKMRHSTSKIKAEAEMDELKEMNKRLQSSLDGASNRVIELQEVKNQTLTQLIDAKAMYDLLLQENTKIKKTLGSYETKYNASCSSTHETKFDELLLEKNTIALELEYKKLQLTEKEKEVNEYVNQVKQLQQKNKELDEELDDYATIIQERNAEISVLQDKLYSRFTENTRISELEQKLENLHEENEKLRNKVDALKTRLQMDAERVEDDEKSRQNDNVIRILKRENHDLQTKLNTLKKQLETRQYVSDANVSLKDASMVSQDQSRDSSKKVPNNLEGAWNRLTELQSEKYEIMKALADSRRQCDNLSKENLEVKKILQLYKGQLNEPNLEIKEDEKLDDENKIAWELDSRTIELNQKEKKLKECVNKTRDLATKNKDLDIELGKSAAIIHERDVEISKLKESLKFLKEENNKLKSEIEELQHRSRTNKNFHNDTKEYNYRLWNNTSVSNGSVRKQFQNSVIEEDEQLKQLKKKIRDLELTLVTKNGRLATLELEIQSQSFPYERKCKQLEEKVLAFSNKNTELKLEIKKLQRSINDVNTWECDVCRRWRVNRKDQSCQTIPTDTIRFCSSNSGVVEDHLKIEKLEREKTMLKTVCRTRTKRVKELETEIDRLKRC